MNKTVSINLGGFFFHIDEDAYQKLNRYFDAIRSSLSPDGKDEIMSDIEGRIAELLSEKLKNDKQVVGIREVDEVITVMGQPEDYRINDEEPTKEKTTYSSTDYSYNFTKTRKFYRDGEKGMVSGVCAGLGHYFKIDPLWIRIIFILSLFISFGTSVLIYILLWILIPKAITTTEKLEMTGEPINISNIEKKVREEINMVTEKLQNVDYDKMGANARAGAEKVGNGIGSVFSVIFRALAKVIGAFITIASAIGLGTVVVLFLVLLFNSSIGVAHWRPFLGVFNYTDIPLWIIGTVLFFATAIPLFAFFLLGLKILVDNMRSIGNVAKYTLIAIWLVSLFAIIAIGISQASQVTSEGKTMSKREIPIQITDTLNIKFRYNDYFTKSFYYHDDFRFAQDTTGTDLIYSNDVSFILMKTDGAVPYIQIEKISYGSSSAEARKRAEKIKYNFDIEGNTLILDNYLTTEIENKFRDQKVEIYLYLPEGYMIKPDRSVQNYDRTDDNFFNLWWDDDSYVYRMQETDVKCLNCPMDPEATEDMPDETDIHFNANGKGEVNIVDENVKVHVSVDSVSVKSSRKVN